MNDKVKITALIKKNNDWYEVNITKADGELLEASLNRTTKKGIPFPNFDTLAVGQEVEGRLWQSQAGKWYLFPPEAEKQRGGAGGAYKEKVIGEAMQRKEASISKFQDSKEWSIMTASSMTNAVNLAIAEFKDSTVLDTLDKAVLKWREFIIRNWEIDPKDYPPFN